MHAVSRLRAGNFLLCLHVSRGTQAECDGHFVFPSNREVRSNPQQLMEHSAARPAYLGARSKMM
jgi:hypothetical protein